MPYSPTTWVEGVTTLGPTNMNHIEQGIATGPGVELAYAEITASVGVTATVPASATTIVTAPAITFDGATRALIEFYAPSAGGSTSDLALVLWQDGASAGIIAYFALASSGYVPVYAFRLFTPATGSRVYSIRGYVTSGTTATISAGGGGTTFMPAFIRVSRA